ncbi:putative quinol monooxygenase [Yinghuangia seranimata]|uniref:putative quinol monooxygenase n=1 Tax=Yinghuangia seranimata TaxID=408067 RepID=UPI00248A9DC2|nr:antibiotic biosynthesis monooxygenase family protein [Yinghuangia seranimata]MDI2127538.1 antibiotic biosynthesis monooxygenase [Yinghuangia seranimata]
MAEHSPVWVSGNWHVADGNGEEFISRWTAFLTWTRDANDGFVHARLLRDQRDPNHFVSFAAWRDADARGAWQDRPDFAEYIGRCRELCADMTSSGYELAAAV